jgi:hypothetical protein
MVQESAAPGSTTRPRPGTDSIGFLSRPDLRAGGSTTPRHLHRTIHGSTILLPIATPPRSRCGRDSWQILFRSIAESPPGLRTGTATRNRLPGPSCGYCCGHTPDPWPGPFGWGGPPGSRGLRWSGAAGEGLATERLAGVRESLEPLPPMGAGTRHGSLPAAEGSGVAVAGCHGCRRGRPHWLCCPQP